MLSSRRSLSCSTSLWRYCPHCCHILRLFGYFRHAQVFCPGKLHSMSELPPRSWCIKASKIHAIISLPAQWILKQKSVNSQPDVWETVICKKLDLRNLALLSSTCCFFRDLLKEDAVWKSCIDVSGHRRCECAALPVHLHSWLLHAHAHISLATWLYLHGPTSDNDHSLKSFVAHNYAKCHIICFGLVSLHWPCMVAAQSCSHTRFVRGNIEKIRNSVACFFPRKKFYLACMYTWTWTHIYTQ